MKLVLFDCDGTLVDSAHVIHDCMARCFADFGHPVPDAAATKSIIGLTLDIAIARLLGREIDAEIAAMTARYKAHFSSARAAGAVEEPMFPGMRKLIDDLAARDEIVLGIVTGKSRRGLGAVLELHGMEQTFSTLRTADDCPSKPHPAMVLECCAETGIEPADTLIVGDAIYDMQMAKAAGALAVAVSWGYATPQALSDAGADAVIERPEEFFEHIGEDAVAGA